MKVHFGNLHSLVSESELTELMRPFAIPTALDFVRFPDGLSKGFAFADFATAEHARAVIDGLNGKEVHGQAINVGEARPRPTRSAPGT